MKLMWNVECFVLIIFFLKNKNELPACIQLCNKTRRRNTGISPLLVLGMELVKAPVHWIIKSSSAVLLLGRSLKEPLMFIFQFVACFSPLFWSILIAKSVFCVCASNSEQLLLRNSSWEKKILWIPTISWLLPELLIIFQPHGPSFVILALVSFFPQIISLIPR